MSTINRSWFLYLCVMFSASAFAAEERYPFETDEQRERFRVFLAEIRCPTCESQNLGGSNAMIAEDMKREIHRLIISGKTDEEITNFIVKSYGEFALYRPLVNKNTMALWLAPLIMLLIGAFALIKIVKNQKPLDQIDDEGE